jgi:hypothetical protein
MKPASCMPSFPSVWSTCQWVLMSVLAGSCVSTAIASRMCGTAVEKLESISRVPSGPVCTAMLPPAPCSRYTLSYSLVVLIAVVAPAARICPRRSVAPVACALIHRGVITAAPAAAPNPKKPLRSIVATVPASRQVCRLIPFTQVPAASVRQAFPVRWTGSPRPLCGPPH